MRLTKTIYAIEEVEGEIIGYDDFGRPIYGDSTIVRTPIECEVEPYSNELAKTRYGVFVDATQRVFCKPNEKVLLTASMEYENEEYQVAEYMDYGRHYEVLIKKVWLSFLVFKKQFKI